MAEQKSIDLTFRQLQIFSTVVHAGSLTRAAKQLEMRQPSISQQIGAMERRVGGKLIRFVNSELRLTPAGRFLLDEAHQILGAMDRAKIGLAEFFEGRRGELTVGVLPSLGRNLLVPVCATLLEQQEGFSVDIVEMTPLDAIEQLTGRTIDLALTSGYAAATKVASGLLAIPVAVDRQLLAVPRGLPDLTAIRDPERELASVHLRPLKTTIRYAFGSEHSDRVNRWYDHLWPHSRSVARCRSYEIALAFVERGLGTALVPEYAVRQQNRLMFEIDLYDMPLPKRELIVLLPRQNARLAPIQRLITLLRNSVAGMPSVPTRGLPPFAAMRLGEEAVMAMGG